MRMPEAACHSWTTEFMQADKRSTLERFTFSTCHVVDLKGIVEFGSDSIHDLEGSSGKRIPWR